MPKSTYYNLSEEKRKRVMQAAVAEMMRVPLSDISINQIVRNAGISRGSFYQYFEDKYDLIRFVLSDFEKRLCRLVEEKQRETCGSLFDTMEEVLCSVLKAADQEKTRRLMIHFLTDTSVKEGGYDKAVRLQEELVRMISGGTDRSRLLVETDEDVYRLTWILFELVKTFACAGLHNPGKIPQVMDEFSRTVRLLRDKMERR